MVSYEKLSSKHPDMVLSQPKIGLFIKTLRYPIYEPSQECWKTTNEVAEQEVQGSGNFKYVSLSAAD